MNLVTAADLAVFGRPLPHLASANYGGLTNRLRCLLTSTAFSETKPLVYWRGNWSGNELHHYAFDEAREVFSLPFAPGRPPQGDDGTKYNDWLVLTPEIINAKRSVSVFCLDALNGDGLKSAEMLYQMPGNIYTGLRSRFLGLFSDAFLGKIRTLVGMCKELRYGVISLRFWGDCVPSFEIQSYLNRLDCNWSAFDDFENLMDSIIGKRWTRLRPSAFTLHSARKFIERHEVENIILMSERWGGRNFCSFGMKSINDTINSSFRPGIERQLANMFVIANAKVFVRSRDSTYTHLPLLLGDQWAIRVMDV